MYIKSVSLKNFGPFLDFSYTFPQEGLIFLTGANKDDTFSSSNGLGKSTLISSLPFALFGRTTNEGSHKKLTMKDAIRTHAQSTTVILELVDNDGYNIVITREVSRKQGFLSLTYNNQTINGQEAQDFINKKLDLTFPSFVSSCFFGQGMFNTFLMATETEKMKLMEDLFHLNDLEAIREKIKKDLETTGELLIDTISKFEKIEQTFTSLDTKVGILEDLKQRDNDELKKVLQDMSYENLQKEEDSLTARFKQNMAKVDEIDFKIKTLEETIQSMNLSKIPKVKLGEPCPTCHQLVTTLDSSLTSTLKIYEQQQKKAESLKKELETEKNNRYILNKELTTLEITLSETRIKLSSQIEKRKKAEEVLQNSESILASVKNDLVEAEKEFKDSQKEIAKIRENRENLLKLKTLLGDKELRNQIANQYLDLVNHYLLKYISTMTNNELWAKFKFNENQLDCVITHKRKGSIPYYRWSGGEKKRIDFCLFLAFNRVNHYLFKNPLNLLLLDEVDDALDDKGVEKVIQVLNEETKNIGLILYTSHRPNIEEYFKQQITLIKKAGVTSLGEKS